MKTYDIPRVTDLGDVQQLTGIFGSEQVQDVLVNPQGQVVQTGTGSIDACPTRNPGPGGSCEINP